MNKSVDVANEILERNPTRRPSIRKTSSAVSPWVFGGSRVRLGNKDLEQLGSCCDER